MGRADAPRPGLGSNTPVITRDVVRAPGELLLRQARRGDRRRVSRELEMSQDAADDGGLGDGGDEAQDPRLTPGAALHIEVKDPFEQPCPAKARGRRAGCRLDPLLARGGGDRIASLAMRGQTAALSHLVHPRRWHPCGQLLQPLQRGEFDPRRAIGPGAGEGVGESPVDVLLQALKRHRPPSGIANQPL